MITKLSDRWRSERGSALVELAIALPLLVIILVATIDFARVFYLGMELTNAARAGAQWGAHSVANSGSNANMQTTAQNAISTSGIAATASRTCQCADNLGNFSATTPANTCTGTCSGGGHLVVTVTVTTSKAFTRVIPGIPVLPTTLTLTRSATMRVVN